ncbi:MAG: helicase-exonuclease AddAB subunit AddA, partial [Firmicutes bacterium]|nr:helicase-exonuclease AddAB subunit AddA [Bacillota bacterium]
LFSPSLGGVAYDDSAALVCGFPYPPAPAGSLLAAPVELHLLEREEDDKDGEKLLPDQGRELSFVEKEAMIIARRIKELVAGEKPLQVWDKEKARYRPVSYRDIVILLRAAKGKSPLFAEVLRQQGVPFYAEQGEGYLASTEIMTMISLLKVIDNPRQDIPLAAVLRSPLAGFTEEELAAVRQLRPRGNFYDALQEVNAQNMPASTAEKVSSFLGQLDNWRTFSRRSSVSELIWQLYKETGYLDYVGGLPQGLQRRADLKALYHRSCQFDRFAMHGLPRFLKFIEKVEAAASDFDPARALGEKEDVVRIMSVHKSKGLEFPVVFLADLGRQMQGTDIRDDLLLHKDLGLGLCHVDLSCMIKYPTLPYLALRESLVREELAEELRILYVALTRARERLILVGSARKLPAKSRKWLQAAQLPHKVFSLSQLRRWPSYLDWLAISLMRHPDAAPLRELAGFSQGLPLFNNETSSWRFYLHGSKITYVYRKEGAGEEEENWRRIKKLQPLKDEAFSTPLQEEIAARLNWRYPYGEYTRKAAKLTVSELKNLWQEEEDTVHTGAAPYTISHWRQPVFAEKEKVLTPVQKGSAVHTFLQRFPLEKLPEGISLEKALADLVEQGFLTEEEAKAVPLSSLEAFFQSSLGKRIYRDPSCTWRELAFTVRLPAHELYPDLPPGSQYVLVQGIIDCLVKEREGFLLLDFKTDRAGSRQDLSSYRKQLSLYSRAVEIIYKKPVLEGWLYFLETKEAVRVK